MRKEIMVYTAIFGNRDILSEVIKFPCANYVCFTDNPKITSKSWKIILCKKGENSLMKAKRYKILPHKIFKDYKYSIWEDGTHTLKVDPRILISFLKKNKIAFFKHPRRTNLYSEVRELLRLNICDPKKIIPQIKRYKKEGFQINKLIASAIIVREHNNQKMISLMEDWWKEMKENSWRDQISFNYVAWKNNINYSNIPGDVYNNSFFNVKGHGKLKKLTKFEKIKNIFRSNYFLRETFLIPGIKIKNLINELRNYVVFKKKFKEKKKI